MSWELGHLSQTERFVRSQTTRSTYGKIPRVLCDRIHATNVVDILDPIDPLLADNEQIAVGSAYTNEERGVGKVPRTKSG